MHPLQIDIIDGRSALRIRWQDDTVSQMPGKSLRIACQCVECRSRAHGGGLSIIPLTTQPSQMIREIHLVNSSTLLVIWEDGHDKSYYSFRTLRELFPPVPQNTIE